MRAKVSRRIVIDASVARSSGGEDAVYPLSKHCRDFLKTMLVVGHSAVLPRAVREEWNKHQSSFAWQWRSTMVARKKVVLEDAEENGALRESIEKAAATSKGREAMLKDAHLVEAAQATDNTVASLDDKVRDLFAAASTKVRSLRGVVWVNPRHLKEKSTDWLEDGALPEKHRRLDAWRG